MAETSDNRSLLLFRVGPVLCCAPSLPVTTIIHPPRLTRPPGSDTARPGIFKYSSAIVDSLDLRFKFGVDQEQWADPCRVIITQIAPGSVGFRVDEIQEVMDTPGNGWSALPPMLPRGIFTQTLLLNDKIYLYAEFDNLFKIPTSGYLRVYIEHLLETQKITQSQPAEKMADHNSDSVSKQTGDKNQTIDKNKTHASLILDAGTQPIIDEFKSCEVIDQTKIKNTPEDLSGNSTNTPNKLLLNETGTDKTGAETTPVSGQTVQNNISYEHNIKSAQADNIIRTIDSADKTSITSKTNTDITTASSSKTRVGAESKTGSLSTRRPTVTETNSTTAKTNPANTDRTSSSPHITPLDSAPVEAEKKAQQETQSSLGKNPTSSKIRTTVTKTKPDDTPSRGYGFVFFIVLVLFSAPLLVWYLSDSDEKGLQKNIIISNNDHDAKHTSPVFTPKNTSGDNFTSNESSKHNFGSNENNSTLDNREDSLTPTESEINTETSTISTHTNTNPDSVKSDDSVDDVSLNTESEISTTESSVIETTQSGQASLSSAEPEIKIGDSTVSSDHNTKTDPIRSEDSVDVANLDTNSNTTTSENSMARANPSERVDTITTKTPSAKTTEQSDYHAEIQSDNTGITIILEAPEEIPVFKQTTENLKTNTEDDIELKAETPLEDISHTQTDSSSKIKTAKLDPAVKSSSDKPGHTLSQTEITHIVVKGDTLWHIAIRYVNNPYLYPELARLSNIKNPDLIYPGNRVRIIKKFRRPRQRQ